MTLRCQKRPQGLLPLDRAGSLGKKEKCPCGSHGPEPLVKEARRAPGLHRPVPELPRGSSILDTPACTGTDTKEGHVVKLIPRLNDQVRHYGTTGRGISARENVVIKTTKAIHLLFATVWAGGAFSMQALSYLRLTGDLDEATMQAVAFSLHFLDTWVVIPGLAGCILTGLFYSLFTSIGFVHFFWIGYKWLIALSAAFWGTLFWGPWGNELIAFCEPYGLAPILRFIRSCLLPESFWQAVMQTIIIFSMLMISVYRPLTLWQALHLGLGRNRRERITLR